MNAPRQTGRTAHRVRGQADKRARRLHARLLKRRGASRKIVGSKMVLKTASERRSAMQAGRRLRRISQLPSVRRRADRTQRYNARRGVGEAAGHCPLFVASVMEYARVAKRPDVATALLESMEPSLTSTPIGVYALDAAEHLSRAPGVSRGFVDVLVLEDDTFAVFFEPVEGVGEETLRSAMAGLGDVEVLTRPGDDVDESSTADLFMIAVRVPRERLDAENLDAADLPVRESDDDDDQTALRRLCSDPCFESVLDTSPRGGGSGR